MALVHLTLEVAHAGVPERRKEVEFLIDSDATCSVVPATLLVELGIEPTSEQRFTIANGQIITRRRGNALFFYQGRDGASPVVFGEEGDSTLLGAVTLEALGFVLDPVHRRLVPRPRTGICWGPTSWGETC